MNIVVYEFVVVSPVGTTCLARLTWIVCEMGGKWSYNFCFVECCFQDLFKTSINILVYFSPLFFSFILLAFMGCIQTDGMTQTPLRRNPVFFYWIVSDTRMIDNPSIAVHDFTRRMLTLLSIDEILLLRYVNSSTNFSGQPLKVEVAPSRWKHMNSVLFAFPWRSIPPAVCS